MVACYLEDPIDGAAFVDTVRALAESGRPTLVLPAGRSEVGARAAQSHTGSLAGSARVTAAAVRDAGGIVVRTPSELVERAKSLLGGSRLRGRRIAILADGGGHGVLAADLLADAGLETAQLGVATAERLAPELPNSQPVNPVDMAGAGEMDVGSFGRLTAALVDGDEVDAVLFTGFFGGYAEYSEEMAAREVAVAGAIADAAERSGKPVLVHSMKVAVDPPAIRALRRRGVGTYRRVEDAILGLDALLPRPPAPRGARRLPAELRPLGDAPAYPEARALLAAAGIAFPDGGLAVDDADVAAIAERVGGPVALKAVSAALLHKTDAGGVALGLPTPAAAAESAVALRARVAAARPTSPSTASGSSAWPRPAASTSCSAPTATRPSGRSSSSAPAASSWRRSTTSPSPAPRSTPGTWPACCAACAPGRCWPAPAARPRSTSPPSRRPRRPSARCSSPTTGSPRWRSTPREPRPTACSRSTLAW